MAKKNVTSTTTTPTPVASGVKGANRFIGEIEDVAPPVGNSHGIAPVWKEALEGIPVGKSRVVTGIGEKSLLQSVTKTAKKHWPERKFRVWVEKKAEDNNGVEVLRVGRLEDKPVPPPSQLAEAAPVCPPGYYYDAATNMCIPAV